MAKKENKRGGKDQGFWQKTWDAILHWVNGTIAELKKVSWPAKKDLINYSVLVIVFVLVMTAIIAIYDFPLGMAMKQWLL